MCVKMTLTVHPGIKSDQKIGCCCRYICKNRSCSVKVVVSTPSKPAPDLPSVAGLRLSLVYITITRETILI